MSDGEAGLQIINISNRANPVLAGSYDTPGEAFGVFVLGNYAYVADYEGSGLQIINVSNPANPVLAGSYETPGDAIGVFVLGNYAYVADYFSGLQILNVSNPANPVLAGSYATPGESQGVFVLGNYAYVADQSSLMILHFQNQTGINENENLPVKFSISQNYPNPFNAQTVIQYSLPAQSEISIDIFDILGRNVEKIAEGIKPAGNHQRFGTQAVKHRESTSIESRPGIKLKRRR